MTDTGQVPGQGLPENAGMVEQPGVPAPGAYTYLDHSGGAPEAVTEDDDLLLMPGAQGAWSDPAAAPPTPPEPAPAAAQGTGHVQPVPVAQAAPGYAGAEAAAPEQPHAHLAQEQQNAVHEERLRTAEQQATPAQGVPQQAAHAQATAGPLTAEQGVAARAATAAQGQPAVQEQPPAPAQPTAAHDQQSGHGRAVPHGQPAQNAQAAAEQPLYEAGAHEAGAHEAGGRDSGSLDLGGVRMPPPAAPAQTPPPARRPLHMGPPVPEANSGVVRSLADRGPAAHRAGGAASQQGATAAPSAGPPAGGPEYLDVPRDEADLPPGPQLGAIPPQGASPWAARHAQPQAAAAVPAEAAPGAVAPVSAETVPPQAVPASVAEPAASGPHPAGVPAEAAPESMATGQFAAADAPLQGSHRPATSPVAVAVPAEAGQLGAEAPAPSPEPAVEPPAPAAATPPPEAVMVSGPEPEPQPAEASRPVTASGSVPAPVAEAAEPVVAPQHDVAAAGSGAAPEPEAVAVVPATREGKGEDDAAAADQAGRTGRSAEALDSTQPAGTAGPAPEDRSTGEPGALDPVPAAEQAPGAEATADAERPAVPAAAGNAAAESVAARAEETAPEAEPPAESRPVAGPESPAESAPGREPEARPVADSLPGAGEDVEADAEEIHGTAAPGYADAEREAVLRVMRERRDIRNGFRSDPVPHDVLLRVLEAAHTAPSVGHSQPWDFVVIRSAETRRSMHELAQRQREAYAKSLPKGRAKQFKELKIEAILDTPVNIVVTADPTRGGRHTLGRHTQPQMAPYSSALAVENLWLAARAEGLGVGWVSFFDEREMVRTLGLPEHLEVVAYLCVGYVDEFPEEPELMQAGWSKRRPLSWVVHEETYGRRALPGEEPHDLLQETVSNIRPLDAKALGEAWERQKRMTKPAGALGMLEIISAQLAGLSRMCPPPIPEPAAVAIFAGDHGVHAQGVTAWPQEVTGQMVANFLGGGAVCNAFANQVGAEVCVIDVGVASDLPATPGLLPRKVRPGTADFTTGPALGREEVLAAIEVGIETARDLVSAGNKALLTGEMGIANTTSSAALISVYTGVDPSEVTGRGTGINDEMHARKVDVVRRALELHQPDAADPVGVLAAVGGLEHAALVGFILGGASLRTPVVLDGVSAGAAALVARAVAPEALAACIAGHRSAEPGHVAALNKLGLRPLVDLDLRLGEGTGALLALPLVQSAARAMHEVATFDSAGVTEK
ncbi:nicotinate-nucleotide--dimethylbenzimidazole phosphoribosyltransferase [Streptomyces sp. HNM0645]|uniref:nicotinate-nucleotide--dimethylbenzimidazole phosphoribosyltransferase n=1 Tax=Streptomyces sp. HNM0645 TaxID=2782343 RepID=UPI0024B66B57|nr:nicotinate-nucleotide--dimethylbenzimidazole phosphoribosyltransferase [Streptomyces sp. HNM0645]MDI9885655.1 nicotinate-nucleotide--dimethylbenzimidazole phosphoribosyltransferase [Streptomyces sp. HNM0645]